MADGDTVTVLFLEGKYAGTEESIRLLGVNTPETVHPSKPVECYGPEASDYTKSTLLVGTAVYLEFDSSGERDKYGRLLAHIFTESNILFNEQLITNGYAHFNNYGNSTEYDGRYAAAEINAQNGRIGLWGVCE